MPESRCATSMRSDCCVRLPSSQKATAARMTSAPTPINSQREAGRFPMAARNSGLASPGSASRGAEAASGASRSRPAGANGRSLRSDMVVSGNSRSILTGRSTGPRRRRDCAIMRRMLRPLSLRRTHASNPDRSPNPAPGRHRVDRDPSCRPRRRARARLRRGSGARAPRESRGGAGRIAVRGTRSARGGTASRGHPVPDAATARHHPGRRDRGARADHAQPRDGDRGAAPGDRRA